MVPQIWIINCLKMYKISNDVINFIEKTMKNWKAELTAGGKSLAETKIQRGIFQGDALSPLIFIIAIMPLYHILRKCTAGYKLSKSLEKINHLMYMEYIKLFAKKWKRTGNSNTRSENIQSGHWDGIWHGKMWYASNEKQQTTPDGPNGTTKSRKNQNTRRKGNLQILRDIGSWHHQTSGDERKN